MERAWDGCFPVNGGARVFDADLCLDAARSVIAAEVLLLLGFRVFGPLDGLIEVVAWADDARDGRWRGGGIDVLPFAVPEFPDDRLILFLGARLGVVIGASEAISLVGLEMRVEVLLCNCGSILRRRGFLASA